MGAVGGDIIEIAFSHPTIGTGVLFPKANEDSTLDLGGFRTNDDANMVDGSGQQIKQLNRQLWMAEATIAGDLNTRQDLEKVTALAGNPVDAVYTITHISGAVYKGSGAYVGDVQESLNNATIKIKIAGGGKLKKIAG